MDDDGTFILAGARTLEPLKQGSLDGLCGLYAIINAIQLTLHPQTKLSPTQQRRLFKRGIRTYRRQRSLAKLLRSGMTERAWCALCEDLIAYANVRFGVHLEHRPLFAGLEPLRVRSALGAIKRHIESGYPVLIALAGGYDHYSVVSGYRLGRLYLFDSGPYRSILTRSIGTQATRPDARHQLRPRGGIALSRG